MEFKKLEFSDLELIRGFYEKYTNKTCDRTIGEALCGVIIFIPCMH